MPGQRKPLSETRAWSCLLVNQLATPGLGSMMGGRYISGLCQLLLALGGCGLILIWLWKNFYSLAFQPLTGPESTTTPGSYGWFGKWGLLCLVASWVWSGITSLSLLRQAKRENPTPPPDTSPQVPGASPHNPS
jgi:hypothetical protein